MEFNCFEKLFEHFLNDYKSKKNCIVKLLGVILIISSISLDSSIISFIICSKQTTSFNILLIWVILSLIAVVLFTIIFSKVISVIQKKGVNRKALFDNVREYCINNKLYSTTALNYLEKKCNNIIDRIGKKDNFFKEIILPMAIAVFALIIDIPFNYNQTNKADYVNVVSDALFWVVIITLSALMCAIIVRLIIIFRNNNTNIRNIAYSQLADILSFLKAEILYQEEIAMEIKRDTISSDNEDEDLRRMIKDVSDIDDIIEKESNKNTTIV